MAERKVLVDLNVDGNVTSDQFIKNGGTSSQFLKADGSVDSTTYSAAPDIYTVASEFAMLALGSKKGDIIKRTDESKTYMNNGLGSYGGTELLTYPDLNTFAYPWEYGTWSSVASASETGGIVTVTSAAGTGYSTFFIIQAVTGLTAGNTYRFRVVLNSNGNSSYIRVVDSSDFGQEGVSSTVTTSGYETIDLEFTAGDSDQTFQIHNTGNDGDTFFIDSASVIEADVSSGFTYFASF